MYVDVVYGQGVFWFGFGDVGVGDVGVVDYIDVVVVDYFEVFVFENQSCVFVDVDFEFVWVMCYGVEQLFELAVFCKMLVDDDIVYEVEFWCYVKIFDFVGFFVCFFYQYGFVYY